MQTRLFIAFFVSLALISCKKENRDSKILGTWNSTSAKVYFLDNGIKKDQNKGDLNSTLEFYSDGTYYWDWSGDAGTYSFDQNYNLIIDGYFKWEILKLTSSKLKFVYETYVPTIYQEFKFTKG
jgi:hypothetical protein